MNAMKRHMGLGLSGEIAATCIWACTATRGQGGEVTFEFAPDKVVRAKGLEGLLKGLEDLFASCVSGALSCTDSERDDILEAMERVLARKEKISDPPTPSGPAGIG